MHTIELPGTTREDGASNDSSSARLSIFSANGRYTGLAAADLPATRRVDGWMVDVSQTIWRLRSEHYSGLCWSGRFATISLHFPNLAILSIYTTVALSR